MTPKRLLRLTLPAMVLLAWTAPHSFRQAHPFAMACVLLAMAMAAACLERPFLVERPPARLLVALLL